MSKKKQLECYLECKATASFSGQVQSDLEKPDQSLEDLLKEQDDTEKTKDNKRHNS